METKQTTISKAKPLINLARSQTTETATTSSLSCTLVSANDADDPSPSSEVIAKPGWSKRMAMKQVENQNCQFELASE